LVAAGIRHDVANIWLNQNPPLHFKISGKL
jgi:hypothetical protein